MKTVTNWERLTPAELVIQCRIAGYALTVLEGGRIHIRPEPPPDLVEMLKQHKPAILELLRDETPTTEPPHKHLGRRLLEGLWDAGYRIRLLPSVGGGWFICPTGQGRFSEVLWREYEDHHDEALRFLLSVLRAVNLTPDDWNRWAESQQNRLQ